MARPGVPPGFAVNNGQSPGRHGGGPVCPALPIQRLTDHEINVIRLVADGRTNRFIGQQLSLSDMTMKSHLTRIGRKLGTGDRARMVAVAMRAGLIR
jgi:DNA-binding NarL/FixJ family response regulator